MPITISTPPVDGPFGPGFTFSVATSFVGPVVSPEFVVEIRTADNEHTVYGQIQGLFGGNRDFTGIFKSVSDVPAPQSLIVNGQPAIMSVVFRGQSGVIESTTIAITLDEVQGRTYELANSLASIRSQIIGLQAGTFGSTDRAELATIKANSLVSFPGIPAIGLGSALQLAGAFMHPPMGFVVRELIGDLDGNGSLTRPAPGVGVNAFGLTWEIQTYGQGIGVDAGLPVRLETRMLELELVHTDRHGHEFSSAQAAFDFSNPYWFFPEVFPTRVNYQIAPSVTLRLYWLLVSLT